MLKIVIGTNEGKVLCISNNEDKIKASMVNYLIDTDQEPTEDFFESRNWGEYDIEVYEYHQPQLNENQKLLLEDLREIKKTQKDKNMLGLIWVLGQRFMTKSNIKSFTDQEILQVLQALEQEED
ncbi:hypothetical protein [uncultured Enterococcus sp.]|uniref:hypothetical protein n=1 Tax=uncultured Enterococcus sp. TaxID=167972 RepID=UPI0028E226D6|nr:hypothetical protein [uncultured Enterococcus sp.]